MMGILNRLRQEMSKTCSCGSARQISERLLVWGDRVLRYLKLWQLAWGYLSALTSLAPAERVFLQRTTK